MFPVVPLIMWMINDDLMIINVDWKVSKFWFNFPDLTYSVYTDFYLTSRKILWWVFSYSKYPLHTFLTHKFVKLFIFFQDILGAALQSPLTSYPTVYTLPMLNIKYGKGQIYFLTLLQWCWMIEQETFGQVKCL